MKKNRLILVALILLPQLLFPILSYGQTHMVKGIVTDESKSPLVGVNVIVEGTTTGTTTNMSGEYEIQADATSKLVFSFVGYISESFVVGDQKVIDVSLSPDLLQISDVVVIGYGTQSRQNLTGAVSKVEKKNWVQNRLFLLNLPCKARLPAFQL